jgi:hypothetical protein
MMGGERGGSSPKCALGSDFHFWQDCRGYVEIACMTFRAQHSHHLAGLKTLAILLQFSSGVRAQRDNSTRLTSYHSYAY